MTICSWCGVRLSWWKRLLFFEYCRTCAHALSYDHPSPPVSSMAHFVPPLTPPWENT